MGVGNEIKNMPIDQVDTNMIAHANLSPYEKKKLRLRKKAWELKQSHMDLI